MIPDDIFYTLESASFLMELILLYKNDTYSLYLELN